MEFKQFLKTNRLKKGLSQNNLLLELINYHESFSSLDVTTISRWERGLSKPTAKRQVLIAQFFDVSYFNEHKDKTAKQFSFRESDISGYSDPYSSASSNIEVIDLKSSSRIDTESYCKLIDTFNLNIYNQKIKISEKLIKEKHVTSAFIYKSEHSIIGHFFLITAKLYNDTKFDTYNELIEYLYKFDKPDEADTMFVPTYYSRDYKCANYSFFQTYRAILSNKKIKRVIWFVHSKYSLDLCINQLNGRIINMCTAERKNNKGFKLRGKHVNYVAIELDAMNIASYSFKKFSNVEPSIENFANEHYY